MKVAAVAAVAVGALATGTSALQLVKRSNGPARVVGMSIERKEISNPVEKDRLRKRGQTVSETLDNFEVESPTISSIVRSNR